MKTKEQIKQKRKENFIEVIDSCNGISLCKYAMFGQYTIEEDGAKEFAPKFVGESETVAKATFERMAGKAVAVGA